MENKDCCCCCCCYSLFDSGFEGSLLPWLQTEGGWQSQGGDRADCSAGDREAGPGVTTGQHPQIEETQPPRTLVRAESVQWPLTGSATVQSPEKRGGTANQTMRSEPVGIPMAMAGIPDFPILHPTC